MRAKGEKKGLITTHSDIDEEEKLLRAFIRGSGTAFSSIYKKYLNELFAYGAGLGFEKELLKDAIQEVFYKLYENRKRLTGVENLKYYLLRMLKNHLLDFYRSRIESNDISSYELTFSIKTTVLDDLISREEQIALQEKVDRLLETLTDRQREAVYLRFILEMDYEKIGELLNMTPQASRKLIFRAVKRLRTEDLPILILLYFSFFLK